MAVIVKVAPVLPAQVTVAMQVGLASIEKGADAKINLTFTDERNRKFGAPQRLTLAADGVTVTNDDLGGASESWTPPKDSAGSFAAVVAYFQEVLQALADGGAIRPQQ